jgi:hypothetical protein
LGERGVNAKSASKAGALAKFERFFLGIIPSHVIPNAGRFERESIGNARRFDGRPATCHVPRRVARFDAPRPPACGVHTRYGHLRHRFIAMAPRRVFPSRRTAAFIPNGTRFHSEGRSAGTGNIVGPPFVVGPERALPGLTRDDPRCDVLPNTVCRADECHPVGVSFLGCSCS